MKTFSAVLSLVGMVLFANTVSAQAKSETFAVAGECGMCKKKIETAAKEAGATSAVWNVASKKLAVTYDAKTASAEKIQQHIAAAGYDTPTATATNEAYNNLHECCQYPRANKATASADSLEKAPVTPKQ